MSIPRKYGKDVLMNSNGSVSAEVSRDDGDHFISVKRRTFGWWFTSEAQNFKDAHKWADDLIALLSEQETPSDADTFKERMDRYLAGYRDGLSGKASK